MCHLVQILFTVCMYRVESWVDGAGAPAPQT
jgi:hypothetical protein